jgi:hypothetical protein
MAVEKKPKKTTKKIKAADLKRTAADLVPADYQKWDTYIPVFRDLFQERMLVDARSKPENLKKEAELVHKGGMWSKSKAISMYDLEINKTVDRVREIYTELLKQPYMQSRISNAPFKHRPTDNLTDIFPQFLEDRTRSTKAGTPDRLNKVARATLEAMLYYSEVKKKGAPVTEDDLETIFSPSALDAWGDFLAKRSKSKPGFLMTNAAQNIRGTVVHFPRYLFNMGVTPRDITQGKKYGTASRPKEEVLVFTIDDYKQMFTLLLRNRSKAEIAYARLVQQTGIRFEHAGCITYESVARGGIEVDSATGQKFVPVRLKDAVDYCFPNIRGKRVTPQKPAPVRIYITPDLKLDLLSVYEESRKKDPETLLIFGDEDFSNLRSSFSTMQETEGIRQAIDLLREADRQRKVIEGKGLATGEAPLKIQLRWMRHTWTTAISSVVGAKNQDAAAKALKELGGWGKRVTPLTHYDKPMSTQEAYDLIVGIPVYIPAEYKAEVAAVKRDLETTGEQEVRIMTMENQLTDMRNLMSMMLDIMSSRATPPPDLVARAQQVVGREAVPQYITPAAPAAAVASPAMTDTEYLSSALGSPPPVPQAVTDVQEIRRKLQALMAR